MIWVVAFLFLQTPAELSDRAQEFAKKGNTAEAEKLWERAIEQSPKYFPALFNLGYMNYSLNRFEQACSFLERAAQVSPDDFNTRYLLGAAQSRLENVDAALRAWRKAESLQPKSLRLLQAMIVEYGKGHYYQDAASTAKRALALAPTTPNVYFLAIKAFQDSGDNAGALEVATEAVRRFPDESRAHFEYGFHLQKLGRVDESLKHLQRAMELNPSYEEPRYFYGDLLLKQGKAEESIPHLEAAIKIRNDYLPARLDLARALMSLKRWEDALRLLEETARIDARHPQPHLLLSQLYFRRGDEKRAQREKELSLRLRRGNPELLEVPQSRPFRE